MSWIICYCHVRKKKKASHASVKHHEQEDILSHNLSENMPRQISRIIHPLIISSLKQVNMWVKCTLLRNEINKEIKKERNEKHLWWVMKGTTAAINNFIVFYFALFITSHRATENKSASQIRLLLNVKSKTNDSILF